MATVEKLYTADDLWEISKHTDKNFELWEGDLVEVTPASIIPSIIANRFGTLLLIFVDEHDLGYVTNAEGGYILSPRNVVAPDVGFFAKARVAKLPERYFSGAPDLAIEVVSPTDDLRKVQRKARKHLAYGTRIVWVVYPEDRTIEVYHPAADGNVLVHEVGIDGILDGEDVLPGLKIAVKEVFRELGE